MDDERLAAVLTCVLLCARRRARAWTHDDATVEEIAQLVGIKFWSFWQSAEQKNEFATWDGHRQLWVAREERCWSWIVTPVKHAAISNWRSASARQRLQDRLQQSSSDVRAKSPNSDNEDELSVLVRTHLDRLPERQREVVESIFFKELSPLEIASQLGLSVDAVYALRRRALESLRRSM